MEHHSSDQSRSDHGHPAATLPDIVSDPAHNVEEGHEWADEGGALPDGPATSSQHSPDTHEGTSSDGGGDASSGDTDITGAQSPS